MADPHATVPTRQEIRAQAASILKRHPGSIDDDVNLLEMGIDSLALMTLASKWRYQGVEVTLREMLEDPTIRGWSQLMARHRADTESRTGDVGQLPRRDVQ
jgi:aryl carrier-like protein